MKKNAQSSLEFLMTYTWAILIFMLAIGALLYFDPFDFKDKLPDQVMFPPPFSVEDYGTEAGGIIFLKMRNNLEYPITLLDVGYGGTKECENIEYFMHNQTSVDDSDDFTLTFKCPDAEGKRVKTYLRFAYVNSFNSRPHIATGYLVIYVTG